MSEDQLELFPPPEPQYEDQFTPAPCTNPFLPGFEPPQTIPIGLHTQDGELSPSVKAVAQLVLDGMSPADAGLTVGYRTTASGNEIVRRPEVRNAMTEAMERRGITRGLLAKTMKRGLKAMTRIYHHGQLVDEIEDHGTRHKYLTTALDAYGDLKQKQETGDESWEEMVFQIRARRSVGRS